MIPIQSCGALVFRCLLAQLSRLSGAQSTAFLFPTAAPTPSPTAAPTEAPTPLPPGDMFARRAATTRDLTFRMEDESFRRAMYEYRSLIERMDASPHRMNGTLPKKILSWNSYCDPSQGCQSAHHFPQWFHNKSRVDALFSLPWDHIADGNYNDMPRDGPSLPVDKCDVSSCPDMQHLTNCKRRRVQSSCSLSQFREAIKSNRDGCTSD